LSDFWALVHGLATDRDRKQAIAELETFSAEIGREDLDLEIFDALWPLAQHAHAILDTCWSSVERIARHVAKFGSITGTEIELFFRA
jgi:hypothetical protein